MRVGIVGLPNAGKSTLFNALTRAAAQTGDYPFTTIEPNVAIAAVPDERLARVAETVGSSELVPATIAFHDIAGLVRGASEGEGLGNRFLGSIRETDAVCHVIRCHTEAGVPHPDGEVDPLRDLETIETELLLADLEQVERRLERVVKQARSGEQRARAEHQWLEAVREALAARPPGAVGRATGGCPGCAPNAARADRQAGPLCRQRRRGTPPAAGAPRRAGPARGRGGGGAQRPLGGGARAARAR